MIKETFTRIALTFCDALTALKEGKKVTRSVMTPGSYIYYDSERDIVFIHNGDPAFSPLTYCPSAADFFVHDWMIIE